MYSKKWGYILLFRRLCELMVISDQPIRWWVHSMYFSADRAPKVYIRLGRCLRKYTQCTVSQDSRAWGTFLRTLSKTLTIVSLFLCDDLIMRCFYALLWPPMQTFIRCQVVITDKCWCHKEWPLFGQILTKLCDQLLWLSSPQVTTLWWISVKGYCKSKNYANFWIGE